MAQLVALGVRTVVSLRALSSDRGLIGELPVGYEHISMKAWHAEDDDVIAFLRLATDPARQPLFVHCQHGAERTGTVIAAYRVVVQGWSKDAAIAEMTRGGYGFHQVWQNLVQYLRQLDVSRLRREAGLE